MLTWIGRRLRWFRLRRLGIMTLIVVIFLVGVARWLLFARGILYGEAVATMASLTVAGIILICGVLVVYLHRRRPRPAGEESRESSTSTVALLLGLAVTAFSTGELIAPNTPVAVAAPGCPGGPVYGARFFAQTTDLEVNARSGPGRDFPQTRRYPKNCTLGFDGYCISGAAEKDLRLGTPDQRWLIVHHRRDLVASAVVLSQSPESKLGDKPSEKCEELGGKSQPGPVQTFGYDQSTSTLRATAPGAVVMGYAIALTTNPNGNYQAIAPRLYSNSPDFRELYTSPDFQAKLDPATIATKLSTETGDVWVAAAVCLADEVPVIGSVRVLRFTLRNAQVEGVSPDTHVPAMSRDHLGQAACNGSG